MSVFSVPLVPGEWYIVITCEKCRTKHILFPDLNRGQAKLTATYGWTCPTCQHRGDYDSTSLERYQHLPDDAE